MRRDLTYVNGVAESVVRVCDVPATLDNAWDRKHPEIGRNAAPFRVYNIGNEVPVDLMEYIEILELKLGEVRQ